MNLLELFGSIKIPYPPFMRLANVYGSKGKYLLLNVLIENESDTPC